MPTNNDLSQRLDQAARILRQARHGVVLSGAGISTPSGIPDFRSADSGLWQHHNPMEVASLTAFRHHPERFFQWVRPLLHTILDARPNAAHQALVDLQKAGYLHGIITQNIDSLHQKAGSHPVIEVHGSLETATCTACYRTFPSSTFLQDFLAQGNLPLCPTCGGLLKPDVVLFGEQLPWQTWEEAERMARASDVMLIAGSSLAVAPVARLPVEAANRGAAIIIVNQTPTYMDPRADVVLRGDVADILPQLAERVLNL